MLDPSPPTGVLVVTVWLEGETDHLRARVTSALNVAKSDEQQFSAEDREEVIERVRTWLTDFEDEHRKPAGQR